METLELGSIVAIGLAAVASLIFILQQAGILPKKLPGSDLLDYTEKNPAALKLIESAILQTVPKEALEQANAINQALQNDLAAHRQGLLDAVDKSFGLAEKFSQIVDKLTDDVPIE